MQNYESTIIAAEEIVESMRLMKIFMLQANLEAQGMLLATLADHGTEYQGVFVNNYLPVAEELDSWQNW
jgi:hypothetical protein